MSSRKKKDVLSPCVELRGALVLVAACFVVGGIAGCLLADGMDEQAALRSYLARYMSAATDGVLSVRFFPILFDTIRIPLLVLLLGSTCIGIVGIPAVFAYRGFCFCFAVSALVVLWGLAGFGAALLIFGLPALLWTPSFFLLGGRGLRCSVDILQRCLGERRCALWPERSFWLKASVCFILIITSALVEYFLIPVLLPLVTGVL